MSAGYSRHRADFYIPNERPKKLWLRELEVGDRARLRACELPPECRGALITAPGGVTLAQHEDGSPQAIAVYDQKEGTQRCEQTLKKSAATSTETRDYLSSAPPEHYTSTQWLDLIRGHWARVEIRNHWRRDALLGEDRARNPNALANLALLRSALLARLADTFPDHSLSQIRELLDSNPRATFNILAS